MDYTKEELEDFYKRYLDEFRYEYGDKANPQSFEEYCKDCLENGSYYDVSLW